MRKLLFGIIVYLCFPFQAFAQESVGFSDPDSIQPLLDYRLPEWGYTNFYLDFSTDGFLRKTSYDPQQLSESTNQFRGELSPTYIYYKESEPRISDYSLNSNFNYSINNRNTLEEEENLNNDFQINVNWDLNEKIYFTESDHFFIGRFSGYFNQERSHFESNSSGSNSTAMDIRFRPTLDVGFGFGRVRNVNPMIRSIRLNERLNSLNAGEVLDQQDIIRAAEQLTRMPGYQKVYDRPQKYFWGEMDNLISSDLSTLTPFDLLYLTDITNETIGLRREGWQIYGTLGLEQHLDYSSFKNKPDNQSTSETSNSIYFTPKVEGVWSKNITLKHQIGITGSFLHREELTDNVIINNNNILNSSANWIYTVTDRVLINTRLSLLKLGFESGDPSVVTFGTEIDYFLENKFSLFADANLIGNWRGTYYGINGSETTAFQRVFNFSAGLRYYFKRQLF